MYLSASSAVFQVWGAGVVKPGQEKFDPVTARKETAVRPADGVAARAVSDPELEAVSETKMAEEGREIASSPLCPG